MSQENQGISPVAPQTFPMKRKRGRPRKDGQINVEKVSATPKPPPDVVTRNRRRKVSLSSETENTMVGQVVSGVLDGSFDAGYLLTVRIGDTDTILRGVVFAPGLSVPVSGVNDVAPHVRMLKRIEIPLSGTGTPTQMHGSTSQYKQKNELQQRIEGSLPTKVSPPVITSPVNSKVVQEDTKRFPEATTPVLHQTDDKNMNSATVYSGGQLDESNKVIQVSSQAKDIQVQKAEPAEISQKDTADLPAIGRGFGDNNKGTAISTQQAAQSELQKEPASSIQPLYGEQDKSIKKVLLPEVDSSSISGTLDNGAASKDSKIDLVTQAEQTAGSDTKHDQLIDVALMYQTVGINKALMGSEPQALATGQVTESIKMLTEDQTSTQHHMLRPESQISADIHGRRKTFHWSQREADQATEIDARPKLSSELPTEIPEREAMPVLPHESEIGKQSVLLEPVPDRQVLNSTAPTKNEDLVSKDAAPRAQSQANAAELNNTDSVAETHNVVN